MTVDTINFHQILILAFNRQEVIFNILVFIPFEYENIFVS